jgi:hypothetical protein
MEKGRENRKEKNGWNAKGKRATHENKIDRTEEAPLILTIP